MILSENRFPLFGIMLYACFSPDCDQIAASHQVTLWVNRRHAKARGVSLGLQQKRCDCRSELVAESEAPDVLSEPAAELECRAEAGPNAITDAGSARDRAETGDAAEFRMEVFATQQPVLCNAELGAGADYPTGRVLAERVV